eukprot:Sspe_Gene.13450::Locus_4602_Transcript_3_3_Confidence_0.600_Length_1225::g.13450::m.13450
MERLATTDTPTEALDMWMKMAFLRGAYPVGEVVELHGFEGKEGTYLEKMQGSVVGHQSGMICVEVSNVGVVPIDAANVRVLPKEGGDTRDPCSADTLPGTGVASTVKHMVKTPDDARSIYTQQGGRSPGRGFTLSQLRPASATTMDTSNMHSNLPLPSPSNPFPPTPVASEDSGTNVEAHPTLPVARTLQSELSLADVSSTTEDFTSGHTPWDDLSTQPSKASSKAPSSFIPDLPLSLPDPPPGEDHDMQFIPPQPGDTVLRRLSPVRQAREGGAVLKPSDGKLSLPTRYYSRGGRGDGGGEEQRDDGKGRPSWEAKGAQTSFAHSTKAAQTSFTHRTKAAQTSFVAQPSSRSSSAPARQRKRASSRGPEHTEAPF